MIHVAVIAADADQYGDGLHAGAIRAAAWVAARVEQQG